MIAKFGVYKDSKSKEPTKVYECHRLLFGVSKKALEIKNRMQKETEEEQVESMIDFVQTIFPDFERDDIAYVDVFELYAFLDTVINRTNNDLHKTQKN